MAQQANTILTASPRAADLKAEVEAIIKPHLNSLNCPPFPLDEVAVMAWVCCRNHLGITTDKEMFKWLLHNFRYYRNLVVEDTHEKPYPADRNSLKNKLDRVVRSLTSPRFGHEMPMRTLDCKDASSSSISGSECITTLANSRQYLRRALGSELKYFPRFFELPPELRLMIYQELLVTEEVLLCSNARYARGSERNVQFTMVQDHPEEVIGETSGSTRSRKVTRHYANTRSPGNTLSLLLSNRRIFQEALPIFYNANTFRIRGVERLVQFLRGCGASRRALFTRIEIEQYDDGRRAITKEVFDLLAGIKQLQNLRISTEDWWFLRKSKSIPKNIQWVGLLCKLKVASLQIESIGGQIASYVREERSRMASEVEQVMTKKKASTTSRARATKTKKTTTAT